VCYTQGSSHSVVTAQTAHQSTGGDSQSVRRSLLEDRPPRVLGQRYLRSGLSLQSSSYSKVIYIMGWTAPKKFFPWLQGFPLHQQISVLMNVVWLDILFTL
jgi:hypothetical protein